MEAKNDAAIPDTQQKKVVKYVPPPLGCPKSIADWIHIVSCLLQWHLWMKQPRMWRSKVTRLAAGV
jgi:hypothetical protein